MMVEFPVPRQRVSIEGPVQSEPPTVQPGDPARSLRGVLAALRSGLGFVVKALIGPTDPLLARLSYEAYYFDMVSVAATAEERPI